MENQIKFIENNKNIYKYESAKIIYFKKTDAKCYLLEKRKDNQISLLARDISIYNLKTGIKLFSKDK